MKNSGSFLAGGNVSLLRSWRWQPLILERTWSAAGAPLESSSGPLPGPGPLESGNLLLFPVVRAETNPRRNSLHYPR